MVVSWWVNIEKHEIVFAYTIGLLNIWQEPKIKRSTVTNTTYPQIIYDVELNRALYGTTHLHLILMSIALLIGASLIVDPRNLQHRLTIYLTTFVLFVNFFTQIKERLLFHIGLTKAEYLFFYLANISVMFLIASIIESELGNWFRERAVPTSLGDLLSILISLGLIILCSLPLLYSVIMISSLSYGLVSKLFLHKECRKEYQNLGAKNCGAI